MALVKSGPFLCQFFFWGGGGGSEHPSAPHYDYTSVRTLSDLSALSDLKALRILSVLSAQVRNYLEN